MKLIKLFLLTFFWLGSLFSYTHVDKIDKDFHHYFMQAVHPIMTKMRGKLGNEYYVRERASINALSLLKENPDNIIITPLDIYWINPYIRIPICWAPGDSYHALWASGADVHQQFKVLCIAIVEKVGIEALKNPELLHQKEIHGK